MRLIAFASLGMLAACSGGGEGNNQAATEPAAELAAGGWEAVSEVTSMSKEDQGQPRLKAETGTRATVNACVAQGEGSRPPAALLAGIEGASCDYQNIYMARGRLNASISCTRPDLQGNVMVSAEGSYTDKGFELNSSTRTSLVTDGDIRFSAKVTGRHTGACQAEAPAKAG